MIVCVIPARGGSKRLPGKNIRAFAGKPIIHHSISAALASGLFDRVIVSTDSQDIARVARQGGAEVPFMRPARLADDYTVTADVLAHALRELQRKHPVETVCCLYATAAFVTGESLKGAYTLLRQSGCACVVPVATFPAPIERGFHRDEEGRIAMVWPEHMNTRSNDLPETWHDGGQFYWYDVERFLKTPQLYPEDVCGYPLPRHLVQDIDTKEDWETAETLFMALSGDGSRKLAS